MHIHPRTCSSCPRLRACSTAILSLMVLLMACPGVMNIVMNICSAKQQLDGGGWDELGVQAGRVCACVRCCSLSICSPSLPVYTKHCCTTPTLLRTGAALPVPRQMLRQSKPAKGPARHDSSQKSKGSYLTHWRSFGRKLLTSADADAQQGQETQQAYVQHSPRDWLSALRKWPQGLIARLILIQRIQTRACILNAHIFPFPLILLLFASIG